MAVVVLVLAGCDQAPIQIRQSSAPPERTISELRTLYRDDSIVPCPFPALEAGEFVQVVSRDERLHLALGTGWTRAAAAGEPGDTDRVVWRRGDGSVRVERVRRGGVGPAWLQRGTMPVVGHPTCAMVRGEAGSIWRRYDPPVGRSASGTVFDGLGEIITVDSLRYRVLLAARSAAARDSLVARVAAAAWRAP